MENFVKFEKIDGKNFEVRVAGNKEKYEAGNWYKYGELKLDQEQNLWVLWVGPSYSGSDTIQSSQSDEGTSYEEGLQESQDEIKDELEGAEAWEVTDGYSKPIDAEKIAREHDFYSLTDNLTYIKVNRYDNFILCYENEEENFGGGLNALKEIQARLFSDDGGQVRNDELYKKVSEAISDIENTL